MTERTSVLTVKARRSGAPALEARAVLRPAVRRLGAVALGFAGGWAVLYGALMPFGLGLTLGLAEDCFAPCAAGAALGAASVVAMNQNPRQVKRTARKLAKGAEHAVTQLDEMVSGFVERKMDL